MYYITYIHGRTIVTVEAKLFNNSGPTTSDGEDRIVVEDTDAVEHVVLASNLISILPCRHVRRRSVANKNNNPQ